MRILFNHGLSPAELYSNTPEHLRVRGWTWFNDRYGWSNTYEGALAGPFKYCFGLIMNRILDDKVRFKIPVRMQAYIDFEIVNGDKFQEHRNLGRFQEIDFINSDFTGYAIRYYFRAKAYQKSYQMYVGGDLKKKFLNGINSGEKYYTIRDVTLDDFIDDVHKVYSELTTKELKDLISFGFRRMHSAMKFGCAITIVTKMYLNCYVYIGNLTLVPDRQIKEYSIRRDRKLRKIEGWKKTPFDGYYYIGLNSDAFEKWYEENKKARVRLTFRHIVLRKIKEELYYKHKHMYIFRVPVKKFKSWNFYKDKLMTREAVFLGEAHSNQFKASDKTWRELIKEYEKRST